MAVVAGNGIASCANLDLFARAVARIQGARLPEGLDRDAVLLEPARLKDWALVGTHSEPGERGDDPVDPLGPAPLRIGVLDAEHERAALLAGEQPVEERGPGTAYVQLARR